MMVLAAFFVSSAILLGGLLAVKMVAECLRRLAQRRLQPPAGWSRPSFPPRRLRSEVPVNAEGPSAGDSRPRTTVHELGSAAAARDQTQRSAKILTFVPKPARARSKPRLVPRSGGAAWRSGGAFRLVPDDDMPGPHRKWDHGTMPSRGCLQPR